MTSRKGIKVDLDKKIITVNDETFDIDFIKAAYERIKQAEGIEAARLKADVVLGRPKLQMPDNFLEYVDKVNNKEITLVNAAKELNISRSSFYRLLEKIKKD